MNHIYRVVFNHATGTYQCVSEFAKAKGKTKSIKALSVAVMIVMGSKAMAADIEFTDGKTHIFDQAVALNGDVLINNNTTITVNNDKQIQFASPNVADEYKPTTANISHGTLNSGGIVVANTETATVNFDNSTLNLTGTSAIGVQKSGVANITEDTQISTTDNISIGYEATGEMNLSASNINAENQNINIGERATGILNLTNGAKISAGEVLVSVESNGTGTLTLDDSAINSTHIVIGNDNVATATLTNSSTLNALEAMQFGLKENGKATINSSDSHLSGNVINIGNQGQATLNSKNDSITSDKWLRIGLEESGAGVVTLDGSRLDIKDEIIVGWDGLGDLNLKNNAVAISKQMGIGLEKGVGKVTLDSSSYLNVDDLIVGSKGKGELVVDNTASSGRRVVDVNNTAIIGAFAGGEGVMTINGETPLTIGKDLAIGLGGTGTLTLNQNSKYNVGHTYVGGNTYLGGNNEGQGGTGTLILNDSTLKTNEIIVGDTGSGTLRLEAENTDDYLTGLYTNQISRNTASQQSDIYINGAEVGITADQPNLVSHHQD